MRRERIHLRESGMIEIGESRSFYEKKRLHTVVETPNVSHCAARQDLPTICVSDLQAALEYLQAMTEPEERRMIWVPTNTGMVAVNRCEFLFAERDGHLLTMVLDHKIVRGVRLTLSGLLSMFACKHVVRCHKGFAVNLRRVREMHQVQRRLWELSFDCETTMPCYLGNTYYQEVIESLKLLSSRVFYEEPEGIMKGK